MRLIDANMFLKVAHSIKEFDDALDPITEELIEQIIEEQPEVEAVPIDWIKDYMLRLPDGNAAYECILVMLEDWEKENEAN